MSYHFFIHEPGTHGFRPRRPLRLRSHRPPPLTISQILAWADSHYARTKTWPNAKSGYVFENPNEKWSGIDSALNLGLRGLDRGSSLVRLLERERGVRNPVRPPRLTEEQIVAWAEQHFNRTGSWPNTKTGPILDSPGDDWGLISVALSQGLRGLKGGESLAWLLSRRFGVRNKKALPRLTVKEILRWVDAYFERTGRWPMRVSGPIAEAPGETWAGIHCALSEGCRGLPGGLTLTQFLFKHRGIDSARHPRLTVAQILAWADAHYHQTGRWPGVLSGPIAQATGETWVAIDSALRTGARGLRGGTSLPKLLSKRRHVRNKVHPRRLTVRNILSWADAHHQRTGKWPHRGDGPIRGAEDETWAGVDWALQHGGRGLRGGSSLIRLLAKHRGVYHRLQIPRLTVRKILRWADAHHKRTGKWPKRNSGPIVGVDRESWATVDSALCRGARGLRGRSSLARLLAKHRGALRNRGHLPW